MTKSIFLSFLVLTFSAGVVIGQPVAHATEGVTVAQYMTPAITGKVEIPDSLKGSHFRVFISYLGYSSDDLGQAQADVQPDGSYSFPPKQIELRWPVEVIVTEKILNLDTNQLSLFRVEVVYDTNNLNELIANLNETLAKNFSRIAADGCPSGIRTFNDPSMCQP